MTVYVDDPVWPWRGSKWAHMTADTHEELHAFARRIGLRRSWFQDKDHHQHYDVTAAKRALAIRMGAVPVTAREYSALYRTLPIASEYVRALEVIRWMREEGEADLALYEPEEAERRIHARYWEWMADRALGEVKAPRGRLPKVVSPQP